MAKSRLRYAVFTLMGMIAVGTAGFLFLEPTISNPIDALYMTIATVTTVGYGDFVPTTDVSKLFSAFMMLGGIGAALFVMESFINLIVSRKLREELGLPERRMKFSDHYIICGFGNVGSQIARQLIDRGESYIIIERNRSKIEELVNQGFNVIEGDAQHEETLERAAIGKAKGLISSLPETYNVMVALTARSMNPDLRIVAEVEDHRNADKLIKAGADRVVQVNEMGARAMISQLIHQNADPVCGGAVKDEFLLEIKGEKYRFCSAECRAAFAKHPERFQSHCNVICPEEQV